MEHGTDVNVISPRQINWGGHLLARPLTSPAQSWVACVHYTFTESYILRQVACSHSPQYNSSWNTTDSSPSLRAWLHETTCRYHALDVRSSWNWH